MPQSVDMPLLPLLVETCLQTCQYLTVIVVAQWLRCRASKSRLRGPGFESCAAVKTSCVNDYLACGEYLCTSSLRKLIVAWLNTSERSRDGVRLNMPDWE